MRGSRRIVLVLTIGVWGEEEIVEEGQTVRVVGLLEMGLRGAVADGVGGWEEGWKDAIWVTESVVASLRIDFGCHRREEERDKWKPSHVR